VLSNGMNKVEVAIVGGGIGGLTTAVALTKAGLDVHVYEQAPAYGEVGGHLTMVGARRPIQGHFLRA
jgi:2-polyprenyl-6-methoxyphenol hydroxylase-like FAD-dependent oxidoreductase